MSITNTEALTRVIEHREIFHDEMLNLMRMRINMVSIRFDCLFQAIFNFLFRQIMLLVLCDCYKVVEKLV